MDGVWKSLFNLLRDGLLEDLRDLRVTSGVGLGAGAAGVVDLVWDVVLNPLGELLLGLLWDCGDVRKKWKKLNTEATNRGSHRRRGTGRCRTL